VLNEEIRRGFEGLSTPVVADALLRLGFPVRSAPAGIRPLFPGARAAGRVLPVRHHGSVDVILEVLENALPGDILWVDNEMRMDEACVGDLVVLEVQTAGLGGVVVLGCHRDTSELRGIGLPLFSYGVCPVGPRPDRRPSDPATPARQASVWLGEPAVTRDDVGFADSDGVVLAPLDSVPMVIETARSIAEVERRQADAVRGGRSLREQLGFQEYLRRRAEDETYTFRDHLRKLGGAIEE